MNVHGFDDSIGRHQCKTVSAIVAYDHPATGDTWMIVIHQAILMLRVRNNLLCTMQMCDNDIHVNDEPKHMVPTPMDNHHAIVIPLMDDEPLTIPLSMYGVVSYFPS